MICGHWAALGFGCSVRVTDQKPTKKIRNRNHACFWLQLNSIAWISPISSSLWFFNTNTRVFLQLISHLPSPNYTAKETFLHAPRQSGWKGCVEVKFLATTNSAALMVTPAYMMTTKSLFPRATRKQHKSCWLTTGNLLRCSSEIPSPLLASLRQTLVSLCVRARAPPFYHCSVKSEKKIRK